MARALQDRWFADPRSHRGEKVTVRILRSNDEERRLEREVLIAQQRYPSVSAERRMRSDS